MIPRNQFFACLVAMLGCMVARGETFAGDPNVTELFPAGGQRGQIINVSMGGEFSNWPIRFWVDRPGLTISAQEEKGKVKIAIDPSAHLGVYWIRTYDAAGASALKPWMVGPLQELSEVEPNQEPTQAARLELPVTVNARFDKNGDSDCYLVSFKEGQNLVARLQAHTLLGSPVDAVMQLCSLQSRDGQIEPFVLHQNHDAHGLDPGMTYKVKKSGDYLIRVFAYPSDPNSSIRYFGSSASIYRLTLTTDAYIHHVLPLGLSKQHPNRMVPWGWNLDGVEPTLVPPLSLETNPSSTQSDPPVPPIISDVPHEAVDLAWLDHELVTAGRNANTEAPVTFSLPSMISGVFEFRDQKHDFQFDAKAGKKIRFTAESKSLGFQTIVALQVKDSTGKVVFEQDFGPANPRKRSKGASSPKDFQPVADGTFRLSLRDRDQRFGPEVAYRLFVETVSPSYRATTTLDRLVIQDDKPTEIEIQIERLDGFESDIRFQVHPLPKGIVVDSVISKNGDATAKAVKMIFQSQTNESLSTEFQIIGKEMAEESRGTFVEYALPTPLAGQHTRLWLTRALSAKSPESTP